MRPAVSPSACSVAFTAASRVASACSRRSSSSPRSRTASSSSRKPRLLAKRSGATPISAAGPAGRSARATLVRHQAPRMTSFAARPTSTPIRTHRMATTSSYHLEVASLHGSLHDADQRALAALELRLDPDVDLAEAALDDAAPGGQARVLGQLQVLDVLERGTQLVERAAQEGRQVRRDADRDALAVDGTTDRGADHAEPYPGPPGKRLL